jgi:DNA-binding CsgD family transcriptional regulator
MSEIEGGLNWSTQHFILNGKDGVLEMWQRYRRGFSAAEKTELWDRWQRGESLKAIGRAFGKPSSSIYCQVAPHGGIRPAPRRRSWLALTLSEREEISRGLAAHQSTRSMARLLGRSPSTVSRELNRNGGYDRYRAAQADEMAWARARRPKRCKLANKPQLRQAVWPAPGSVDTRLS